MAEGVPRRFYDFGARRVPEVGGRPDLLSWIIPHVAGQRGLGGAGRRRGLGCGRTGGP